MTSKSDTIYHVPALLDECITGLNIQPGGTYVDVTYGGGGHSRAIMERLGPQGRLIAFDQDQDAAANALADPRFTFVHSNFAFLRNFLRFHGVDRVDGLLADLGVSFHHFDSGERGFSFRADAPLDMRMNQQAAVSAATLVATAGEDELARILHLYGELRQARRMAAALVRARERGALTTTGQLVEAVRPLVRPAQEKKELAQVFQALRIAVNHEMDALEALLQQSLQVLAPGGRLVVLTYHSLEDRMVKNFVRSGNVQGVVEKDFYGRVNAPLRAVNNKVIVAGEDEVARNPRSRSAKLRVAQRV